MQTITSVGDLTPSQKRFLLRQGSDPKDEEEMKGLTRRFNRRFSANVAWADVRRLVTKFQRRQRRRNGGERTVVSLPDPPCVKVVPGR